MNLAGVNPVIVLASLLAVAIGLADLWFFGKFNHDTDLLFIVGGLSALGVHFVNGSGNAIIKATETLVAHADAVTSADAVAAAAKDAPKA